MIYRNKLPEGYRLVLLGDGFISAFHAMLEAIKYPERVTLIGRIPLKSWIYKISDFKRIIIPKEIDIQASTLQALRDSIDGECSNIPLLVALNDEYKQVIRLNAKNIENLFIIAEEN